MDQRLFAADHAGLASAGKSVWLETIDYTNQKGVRAMKVEMEVSLYPLTEETLEHPVLDFADVLKRHGCEVEIGPMSSIVTGESIPVFEALRLGYEQAAQKSGCVLIIKACNVCPL